MSVAPLIGRRLLPVLDEIRLAAGEVEDAADVGFDPAAAERLDVDAALGRGQDVGRPVLASVDERVGHARDRQVSEALAAAVAGALHLELPGREDVGHELDAGRRSLMRTFRFICVPSSSKLVVPSAFGMLPSSTIVKTGLATCLAELAGEDADLPGDVVRLERVADGLVHEDAAPAVLHDDIHLAGRSVLRVEHGDRLAGAALRATCSGVTASNISKPECRLRRSRPMCRVSFPSLSVCTMKKSSGSSSLRYSALAVGDDPAADLVVVADRGHPDPLVVVERSLVGAPADVEAPLVGDLARAAA